VCKEARLITQPAAWSCELLRSAHTIQCCRMSTLQARKRAASWVPGRGNCCTRELRRQQNSRDNTKGLCKRCEGNKKQSVWYCVRCTVGQKPENEIEAFLQGPTPKDAHWVCPGCWGEHVQGVTNPGEAVPHMTLVRAETLEKQYGLRAGGKDWRGHCTGVCGGRSKVSTLCLGCIPKETLEAGNLEQPVQLNKPPWFCAEKSCHNDHVLSTAFPVSARLPELWAALRCVRCPLCMPTGRVCLRCYRPHRRQLCPAHAEMRSHRGNSGTRALRGKHSREEAATVPAEALVAAEAPVAAEASEEAATAATASSAAAAVGRKLRTVELAAPSRSFEGAWKQHWRLMRLEACSE
jgi:hypothetical protein